MKQRSALLLVLSIISLFLLTVQPANAAKGGKEVWADGDSSLIFGGDVRFRYESDKETREGEDDKSRDRQRIRLRLNGKYKASDNVSLGFRLATGSEKVQSQHQTLGFWGKGGKNGDFGVDRAFLKIKSDSGLHMWLGKNGIPLWNPADIVWDSDIQPEGGAIGYKSKIGGAKLKAGFGYFMLSEGHWDEDDNLIAAQAKVSMGEEWKVSLAGGILSFVNGDDKDLVSIPEESYGFSHTISHFLAEVHGKELDFKPKIGIGYSISDIGETDFGVEDDDTTAMVIYAGGKIGGVGLSAYYWECGYASQPALGALAQDNFPYSTNFTGTLLKASYKFSGGIAADLKYYAQSVKNADIDDGHGYSMSGEGHERSRVQLNLNLKF